MRHLKGSCYLTLGYWNAGTNSCIIAGTINFGCFEEVFH